MGNTKIRPETEIYDQYWKMTAGLTDIYSKEFTDCLKIIVDYIDMNKKAIKKWNKKKGMVSSKSYFRGSDLYDNLVERIISYMNYTSKSAETSARKVINQYVKIGFIYPFLSGYNKLVLRFVQAITQQEKKVLFSKMFYEGASFSSASPTNQSGAYRTLTGTGGDTWEALGVSDIVGNVNKWVVARLVDGEIQIIPNNNAAIHNTDLSKTSAAWKAILQDGSLVAPGTAGTLKFDYTGDPANATTGFHITTALEHQQADDAAGYGAKDFGTLTAKTGVTVPDLLKALALFPNTDKTGRGYIYFRNNGERLLLRGGSYGSSGDAGGAYGHFYFERSRSFAYLGLFSAYVDPALYA